MTSTQTHKVIMGIRSEHRGVLGHEQNTSGNTIFSIVLVLFFCQPSFVLCVKNIAKKKSLFCGQCPKEILGKLRINLFFHSIGESGGEKILSSLQNLPKNIWTKMIVFSRHQNHN